MFQTGRRYSCAKIAKTINNVFASLLLQIAIFITDINNKSPEPDYDNFNTTVYIYENATTGDDITFVAATDLDRDGKLHLIVTQIS